MNVVLQIAVQLPTVLKLLRNLRPVLDTVDINVRKVLTNFIPVFVSRGVVQISAFVDAMLAGLISSQAVAALTYAQSLYTLPVSLFGMSVSAAELPARPRAWSPLSSAVSTRPASSKAAMWRLSIAGWSVNSTGCPT